MKKTTATSGDNRRGTRGLEGVNRPCSFPHFNGAIGSGWSAPDSQMMGGGSALNLQISFKVLDAFIFKNKIVTKRKYF
jgi:hypothetical protein